MFKACNNNCPNIFYILQTKQYSFKIISCPGDLHVTTNQIKATQSTNAIAKSMLKYNSTGLLLEDFMQKRYNCTSLLGPFCMKSISLEL